jgi:hypothetical protein
VAYSPVAELRRFGRWRTERVLEIAERGDPDRIHGSLLLAIASRESSMRNIIGGGYFDDNNKFVVTGEDRGLWQINQRYHGVWLDSVPGCDSGSYEEDYDSALPQGRVPGLTRAAYKARDLLRGRISYMAENGVPDADVVRVAVAAYNAGTYGALKGYREGDPDKFTTGHDYSKDVLERKKLAQSWLQTVGWGKKD